MITGKKTANAIGGKTARACDSCLRKRARWFCAADDAFLCQSCDTSVHSANQLASRHERVRLHTSSNKGAAVVLDDTEDSSPAWHRGFTRKARTPRHNNKNMAAKQAQYDDVLEKLVNDRHDPLPFVPEMSNEDEYPINDDENEAEQLLYRVPVFDPFATELCNPVIGHDNERAETMKQDGSGLIISPTAEAEFHHHQIDGILPSELELAEFAADVESLLGGGLEEDQSCTPHDIKGLELEHLGCKEEDDFDINIDVDVDVDVDDCINLTEQRVKVEEEETHVFQVEEDKLNPTVQTKKRDILLNLNHEAVIAAWASQGSPWTTGIRPDFNPDHGWPDCLDVSHTDVRLANGDSSTGGLGLGLGLGLGGRGGSNSDGGREARVLRYREKRRTRLFSKKIRYEVRKLNAEKRPRMKGRFVKRTSFMSTSIINNTTTSTSGTTFPYQLMMSK